ncbi:uncharacterized protein [Montipora foliosa]|uniref:uncharacterized protein n=1 Tax=Montipora foliosa TaxID=591990 RepID=UPI0035F15164
MYIDDLKVFASSEAKLNRVLKSTSAAIENIGLTWNPKKCNVIHVRKGAQVHDAAGVRLRHEGVVESLDACSTYKFLGVRETVMQDERLALECAAKAYLQRLSLIWISPLSDSNRVTASNQFALPVLSYLMWTQHWPITELRVIDREARKIICENGGKHPLSSTAMLYPPRDKGGRGLRAIEQEYKLTKIKSAIKLYENTDPTMRLVQKFEERASEKGFTSLVKEACKYAEELDTGLNLNYPNPSCSLRQAPDTDILGKKVKGYLRRTVTEKIQEEIESEQWHGRFLCAWWQDEDLSMDECFAWLRERPSAPTYTITGVLELYEQLTPTRVYPNIKTGTSQGEITCRLCGGAAETLAHVLAGCPALAQSKYLERHNAALQVLFFEVCKGLQLMDSVPPWYSLVAPKPVYESPEAQVYWDVPVYAEQSYVKANRVDVRFVDHRRKRVWAVEMSCLWSDNRRKKEREKTEKYAPLRWELRKQYPDYFFS